MVVAKGGSKIRVCPLQHCENFVEGVAKLVVVGGVHDKAAVRVGTGADGPRAPHLTRVPINPDCSAGFVDLLAGQFDGAEEAAFAAAGVDSDQVAADPDVVGVVEEASVASVAVVVTGLGLGVADLGEFGIGIEFLVGARTEEDSGLIGQMLL